MSRATIARTLCFGRLWRRSSTFAIRWCGLRRRLMGFSGEALQFGLSHRWRTRISNISAEKRRSESGSISWYCLKIDRIPLVVRRAAIESIADSFRY